MFSSARKRTLIAKNIDQSLLNENKASGIRLREKPISTNQPKIQCTRERSFTKLLLKKFPSSEQQYLGRRWLWPSKGANQWFWDLNHRIAHSLYLQSGFVNWGHRSIMRSWGGEWTQPASQRKVSQITGFSAHSFTHSLVKVLRA